MAHLAATEPQESVAVRWDRRGEEGPRKAAKVSAVPDVTHVPAELGGVAHVHEVERNVDGGVETIEE
jgi:hypothetical protein